MWIRYVFFYFLKSIKHDYCEVQQVPKICTNWGAAFSDYPSNSLNKVSAVILFQMSHSHAVGKYDGVTGRSQSDELVSLSPFPPSRITYLKLACGATSQSFSTIQSAYSLNSLQILFTELVLVLILQSILQHYVT